MKKLMIFLCSLVLLAVLPLTGFAAQAELTVSNVTAEVGETVFLTVSLTDATVGNAMAITFTYDDTLLEALPEKSTWARKGLLQDFDSAGNAGVWTVKDAGNLQGDVCVLAFRVLPKAAFAVTKVGCTLIVKKNADDVGTFTAEGAITCSCDHEYGTWADRGILGHTRECVLCGAQQTQSHSFGNGVEAENGEIRYTCDVCSAVKTIGPAGDVQDQTQPTQESTVPAGSGNQDTNNQGSNDQGTGNQSSGSQDSNSQGPLSGHKPSNGNAAGNVVTEPEHNGQGNPSTPEGTHDHAGEQSFTNAGSNVDPDQTHDHTGAQSSTDADHTHDHGPTELDNGETAAVVLVIVAAVAITAGAIVYFSKKKD